MIKASSSQLSRSTREMAIVVLVGTDLRGRSAVHNLSFLGRKTVLSLVLCEHMQKARLGKAQ